MALTLGIVLIVGFLCCLYLMWKLVPRLFHWMVAGNDARKSLRRTLVVVGCAAVLSLTIFLVRSNQNSEQPAPVAINKRLAPIPVSATSDSASAKPAIVTALYISPLVVQQQSRQTEPYEFQDTHLGMSLAEFQIKHPAFKIENEKSWDGVMPLGEAGCTSATDTPNVLLHPASGETECVYQDAYLGIRFPVWGKFIDGKLAEIIVDVRGDIGVCFDPPDPGGLPDERSGMLVACQPYGDLWKSLMSTLGQATIIRSVTHTTWFFALRWENDVSVAEFQKNYCAPGGGYGSNPEDSKDISEILEGQYCEKSDFSPTPRSVMLYLDKELGRTLAMRLEQTTN